MTQIPTCVTCERCGDETSKVPPANAWLGRHAHGTASVAYRAHWTTTPTPDETTESEGNR